MDIVGVLWQFGIIVAVLLFGFKIGLASGLANLSKRLIALIILSYCFGILILSWIGSFYVVELNNIIYGYNSLFYLIMASIMILAGILTIKEWHVNKKNTSKIACLAIIVPCPCCFGSIIGSILIVAPIAAIGVFDLSKYIAVALAIVILISYFASKHIVKLLKNPYPVVLGNFMFFLGAYFILSSLLLPTISQLSQNRTSSITINSMPYLIGFLITMIILIGIGIILKKKDNILK